MGAPIIMSAMAAMMIASSALAQTSVPDVEPRAGDIVVQGRRTQPSNWREAETEHVIVLSDGNERELTRTAHDLERLHFLLSGLTGRADKPDDMVKLRVTLIGDMASFSAMNLRNLRWQQGPFPPGFDLQRYYDPREDGAVLATTRIDQVVTLDRSAALAQVQARELATQSGIVSGGIGGNRGFDAGSAAFGGSALAGINDRSDPLFVSGVGSFALSAQSMLYAAYAQHFLLTYFPAAYPRWYLDGFGQVFATMVTRGDTVIEFGHTPLGTSDTLNRYGDFALKKIFDDSYLRPDPDRMRWTPMHAWMLTHFLFFSDIRRPQLRRYLAAFAQGARSAEAAAAFGDMDGLARELRAYYRSRKPYERITYPAAQAAAPVVRRLSVAQAAFVKGRLELSSRVETPTEVGVTDSSAKAAARASAAKARLVADRERWLTGLRRDAALYPGELGAQLLLAEAECRVGNADRCAVAADRALVIAPADSSALAWKGMAMTQAAMSGPADALVRTLTEARAVIAKANRADTEAVLPMLAYYRNRRAEGPDVPELAVDALAKVVTRVPNAPGPRLMLGQELARRGATDAARATLLPVAKGGYDTPERGPATVVLDRIGKP